MEKGSGERRKRENEREKGERGGEEDREEG